MYFYGPIAAVHGTAESFTSHYPWSTSLPCTPQYTICHTIFSSGMIIILLHFSDHMMDHFESFTGLTNNSRWILAQVQTMSPLIVSNKPLWTYHLYQSHNGHNHLWILHWSYLGITSLQLHLLSCPPLRSLGYLILVT